MNTKERLEMIDKILKHSDKDVEKISEKESITPADLCVTKDFAKTMYYKKVLESMEEYGDDEEYSERGYSRRGRSMRGSYEMDDGWSGRRGRDARTGRYVSRDNGSYRGSYRGYSRDDAKDEMMDKLEEAMESATTEHERMLIRKCMEKLDD